MNITLNKSNILSFNSLNNLLITMFLFIKKYIINIVYELIKYIRNMRKSYF